MASAMHVEYACGHFRGYSPSLSEESTPSQLQACRLQTLRIAVQVAFLSFLAKSDSQPPTPVSWLPPAWLRS